MVAWIDPDGLKFSPKGGYGRLFCGQKKVRVTCDEHAIPHKSLYFLSRFR